MKKILILIIVLCLSVFSCFAHSFIHTLNYSTQGTNLPLSDVITGYDSTSISLKENEIIYYNLLDKDTYSSLEFFDAISFIFHLDDALSLTFASSKIIDTNKYDSMFFLCDIIIFDNETYLYVSYITDDGFCNTLYKADNNILVNETMPTDFEPATVRQDLFSDVFSTVKLFLVNYVFIIITVVVIIYSILIVYKKIKKSADGSVIDIN